MDSFRENDTLCVDDFLPLHDVQLKMIAREKDLGFGWKFEDFDLPAKFALNRI
jgi:hypothetical protein